MKHAIAFMALILGLGTAAVGVADTPISNFIYVDSTAGNDSNDGSASSPVQTLARAIQVMDNLSDPNNTQIMLRAGTTASPKTYPVSSTITWPAGAADNIIITSDKVQQPSAAQIVGAGDLASGSGSYGLFHIESTSAVEIEFLGITFDGLKSSYNGGVISCFSPSEINFFYCYFFNCSSNFGGAIYYAPGAAASSFDTGLEVWCSYFYNCSATSSTYNDGKGGAIKVLSSSYTARAEVTSTTFEACSADEDGGAIVAYGDGVTLYSIGNSYYHNTVSSGGGGAVYVAMAAFNSFNDMFVRNSAADGGALLFETSSTSNECDVVHGTFVSNAATAQGGALAVASGHTTNAEACIFYNNTAGSGHADVANNGAADDLLVRYCRLGSTSGLNTVGGSNITGDPAFVNASFADLGTLNLNLTADSPCRGENLSSAISSAINGLGLNVDARGVARSNGGSNFDMGALEYLASPVRIFTHGHNTVSGSQSAFSLVGLGSSIPGGPLGGFDTTRSNKPSLWQQFITSFGSSYDPSIVRLFNWNGSAYTEATGIPRINNEGGTAVGAWLITAEDSYVGGADHPIEPQNHYCPPIITIPANSWGMVPNPYFEAISIEPAADSNGEEPDEGLKIRVGDGEFMDFSRARLYTSQLFSWNASTSTYDSVSDTGTLQPMTSYWLYNNSSQPLTIAILFEVDDEAIFSHSAVRVAP